jgi:uncharacterized protein YnzC (UPF0291/DUF896 family)
MKLKQLIAAYKMLGEAKVTKLDFTEALKIIKARKAMRPFAEEYDAFLKDCQEKFKPEYWDEVQAKAQKWESLTDDEKKDLNIVLMEYNNKINNAVLEELEKEVEVTVEKLNEDALTNLLQENGWKTKDLDNLEVFV